MLGQRCTNCMQENPVGNARCQYCGIGLSRNAVAVTQGRPMVLSQAQLPARQLKRLGASVAVGTVALLAEMGFIYLRRRLQRMQGPLVPTFRRRAFPAAIEVRAERNEPSGTRVVTVFSERVVEERRWGRPVRRIVDRLVWRSEETLES